MASGKGPAGAVFVARHGERVDYQWARAGKNWAVSSRLPNSVPNALIMSPVSPSPHTLRPLIQPFRPVQAQAARPWDSPLTPAGVRQGEALGRAVERHRIALQLPKFAAVCEPFDLHKAPPPPLFP